MSRPGRLRDHRGFTLVEAAVCVVIVGTIAALAPRLLIVCQSYFSQSMARTEIQRDLRSSVDQMQRLLRQASASTISIDQDVGQQPFSRVSFTLPDGTNVVFELENRKLMRVIGARSAVLARNVEYLAFTWPRSDDPALLSIAMTVKKRTLMGSAALQAGVSNVRVMNP